MIKVNLNMLHVVELVSGVLLTNSSDGIKNIIEELTNAPANELSIVTHRGNICRNFLLTHYASKLLRIINKVKQFSFTYEDSITELQTLIAEIKNQEITVEFDRYPTTDNDSFFLV
jgi:uncharacterized membrane protein